MKLVSYSNPHPRVGSWHDDVIVDLQRAYSVWLVDNFNDVAAETEAQRMCPTDMSRFAATWTGRFTELQTIERYVLDMKDRSDWLFRTGVLVNNSEVRLLPPVVAPTKVLNCGNSYLGHILNKADLTGTPHDQVEVPKYPKLSFFKPPSCLIAHGETIHYPTSSSKWDFEAEFTVIIGKYCQNVEPEDALDYVMGYTIANDVSDRDIPAVQGGNTSPPGKGTDTFGPMGPWIVPRETLEGDPDDLAIRGIINGEVWQDSRTSDLLWPLRDIVSVASKRLSLLPGDVILTGAPPGMGFERQKYLKSGDVIRIEVEGIGVLENRVA